MRRTLSMAWLLLFMLIGMGAWVASQKPLWNDEYYSLIADITNISYRQILSGGVTEGNNSPLFYILQKFQCNLFFYHPPYEWINGHWGGVHPVDQLFLRVQPVVLMSAALSVLFYYFCRRYSLLWGFYALSLALSSPVVWSHWFEARPYALWFALSIFQMLFLLDTLQVREDEKKDSRTLILTHFLLALTTTISAVQIIAAGSVLWIWKRCSWQFILLAVVVPLGIILFYYSTAPKYNFFFINGPISLISANFPKDRLILALVFFLTFIYHEYGNKKWMMQVPAGYLVFMALMLAIFAIILEKLKLSESGSTNGFQISGRYFMSLAPLSIIGTTIFSIYLMQIYKSRIWKTAIFMVLAIFLIFRMHQTSQLLGHWH